MPTRRQTIALAGAFSLTLAAPSFAQSGGRANPMPEDLRKAIERDPSAPVLGNPDGDVTLTEFFDYNCGFCKKMLPTMQKLISSDPKLRVVFREWPVFGEGSEFAARVSLASLQQGKYWQTHTAIFGIRGRAEEASVMRAIRGLGLDEAKLRKDMESDLVSGHIASSFELADHMGLVGTPTLIAGDEATFGAQTLADIQALVGRARKTLGKA